MNEKKTLKSNFGKDIDLFINQIQSLHTTLPLITTTLKDSGDKANRLFTEFLETKCEKVNQEGRDLYIISSDHRLRHRTLKRNSTHTRLANSIVRKNFIVSLISQFDAYLGSLIRAMFIANPERLNSSEKTMSFSKLLEFSDLDEAREYIIEKEVESVLRESHAAQFKWLESKVGIPLTKDLPSWANFIEVTERRNLFVHSDGAISSQYINICRQHDYKFVEEPKVGLKLRVSPEYFNDSYKTLFEIGLKLGQVLWRKLLPSEMVDADLNLLNHSFELIQDQEYDMALNILLFATEVIKKHSSDDIKLRLMLNLAQCYKWKGDMGKCKKIVNGIDWSAYSNTFKLASSVLLEEYSKACQIMRTIGSQDDDLNKGSYKDWPIFKEFRKTQEFLKTFNDVFGEQFQLMEEAENKQSA